MTEIDAYQEYIRCKHNAFCKAVIRYAAIGKIIRLQQKWEREISLDECSYDENGTRRQDIEIYYSFVGKIDLPE